MVEEEDDGVINVDAMDVDEEQVPSTTKPGKGKGSTSKGSNKSTSSARRKGKRKADAMDETPEEERGEHSALTAHIAHPLIQSE